MYEHAAIFQGNRVVGTLYKGTNCRRIVVATLICLRIFSLRGALFNTVALRETKIVYNFGLSECNRVKEIICCLKEAIFFI